MPFTVAHAAVIYPFRRLKINISTTAFIAGAIVPDFEGFLLMRHARNVGHHWEGILMFDIPVGFVLCLFFHQYVKLFLLMNLPCSIPAQYFKSDWSRRIRNNYFLVTMSLVAGILSHLILDGFTHKDGMFIYPFPFLMSKMSLLSFEVPFYFFLQVVFSLIGLLLVVKMIVEENLVFSYRFFTKYTGYLLTVLLIIAGTIALLRMLIWPAYDSLLDIVKCLGGAVLYSLLFVSFMYRIVLYKKLVRADNKIPDSTYN